jgi:plasminogen activator inhibitor 1 RNA-binding protein
MYHVGVSNIFELLGDEGEEGVRRAVPAPVKQEAQPKPKGTSPVVKETPRKAETAPATKGTSTGPRNDRAGDRRPPRSDQKFPPRDGQRPVGDVDSERRPPRRDNKDRVDRPKVDRPQGERPPRERTERTTERTTDRREPRENKENRDNAPRGGKRPFESRSGTGRGREVKRSGAGKGNWGKEGEDTVEESASGPTTDDKPKVDGEAAKEETPEPPRELSEEEKLRLEEEEKEAKQMTLDDYLKKMETKKLPGLPAPRKAGEGVDNKDLQKWASYQVLEKDDEEQRRIDQEAKEKKKDAKKQVVPLDSVLKVQTKKPKTERNERGEGRGEGRGRGAKPAARGGRRGGPAPNVKDDSSFPTLTQAVTQKA